MRDAKPELVALLERAMLILECTSEHRRCLDVTKPLELPACWPCRQRMELGRALEAVKERPEVHTSKPTRMAVVVGVIMAIDAVEAIPRVAAIGQAGLVDLPAREGLKAALDKLHELRGRLEAIQ